MNSKIDSPRWCDKGQNPVRKLLIVKGNSLSRCKSVMDVID